MPKLQWVWLFFLLGTPNLKCPRFETIQMGAISRVNPLICRQLFPDAQPAMHFYACVTLGWEAFAFLSIYIASKIPESRRFWSFTATSQWCWPTVRCLFVFFQPCNLVVFILFYKDCWNPWKVVFQSRALDCFLYAGRLWCLAGGAWNVIWSACMIELSKITLIPSWWLSKVMLHGEQFSTIFKDLAYIHALQGSHQKAV